MSPVSLRPCEFAASYRKADLSRITGLAHRLSLCLSGLLVVVHFLQEISLTTIPLSSPFRFALRSTLSPVVPLLSLPLLVSGDYREFTSAS